MRVFKFLPPYKGKNTTFPEAVKRSGVYIIKKAGKIVYVGFSGTNIYKTMYRHFQSWNDRTQQRVTYKNLKNITVRVIYCTPVQANRLEKFLILKYKPIDNPIIYDGWAADHKENEAGEIYLSTPTDVSPF
jgi:excinuclease UvrABC nuclease subunit